MKRTALNLDLRFGPGVPVYEQIIEQVKRQIATGVLPPGGPLPTVRDLAHQVGLNPGTVAKAYAELERQGIILTRRGGGSSVTGKTNDAFLASIREERLSSMLGRVALEALSLGFEPDEVEASLALQLARWRERRTKSSHVSHPDILPYNQLVFVGSHDLAVDLLFGQFRRTYPDLGLSAVYVGSLAGLMALGQGQANFAGCHLLDEETGEYNLPYVRHLFPSREVVLVTVVERVQGLMVPKGNPLGIDGLPDLTRKGVRFVNRQSGSGTRVLLDFMLRQLAIPPSAVTGYEREEETHLAVASAIASGDADVGLGIYAAARSFSLDFIPLQKERYDLAMLGSTLEMPAVQHLLQILSGAEFQKVVAAMGGYEVVNTGRILRI